MRRSMLVRMILPLALPSPYNKGTSLLKMWRSTGTDIEFPASRPIPRLLGIGCTWSHGLVCFEAVLGRGREVGGSPGWCFRTDSNQVISDNQRWNPINQDPSNTIINYSEFILHRIQIRFQRHRWKALAGRWSELYILIKLDQRIHKNKSESIISRKVIKTLDLIQNWRMWKQQINSNEEIDHNKWKTKHN